MTRLFAAAALLASVIALVLTASPAAAQATSSISTTVNDALTNAPWSGTEVTGSSAYDTATVTGLQGGPTPTGTVTYEYFTNGTCGGTAAASDIETLNPDGSVPNSSTEGPLVPGSYSFDASYSGDTNYDPSPASSCEQFSVGPAASSVSTTVNDAFTNAHWSGTEVTGSSAYDTATVTGLEGGPTPTGTVTYEFFTNGTCNGVAAVSDTATMSGGDVPSSSTEGPLVPGSYSFDASYSGDTNYDPSPASSCEQFSVGPATSLVFTTVNDASTNAPWAGTEVFGASAYDAATVSGLEGGPTPTGTVTYEFFTNGTCNGAAASSDIQSLSDGSVPVSSTEGPLVPGSYSFDASYSGDTNYDASPTSSCQGFSVGKATPDTPTITNLPVSGGTLGDPSFPVDVSTNSDGTISVTSNSTSVCTVGPGLSVNYVASGTCSLTAHAGGSANYNPANGSPQTFSVYAIPTTPWMSDTPTSATFGSGFEATVTTNGDGIVSVASTTPDVCTVQGDGISVSFVGTGTCTLTPSVGQGVLYRGATGSAQSFVVARAVPSAPTVTNVPNGAVEFTGFTATVLTNGDGTTSVASTTPAICSIGPDGLTVFFLAQGVCTLVAGVGQGTNFLGAAGNPQSFAIGAAPRGYWLVGSDGGIFSFGAAAFHGSMGGIPLQRPVVAITPTLTRAGYWLVASDGGIFSFGDATFYGSVPGLGLHPAGSGLPNSLDAPIVGMVPTVTRHGYFMVASDGGVFAFGDAHFEGSCPGIGGCDGPAVAVMPDHTGNGYWLVTSKGGVYSFGDAAFYGAPPPATVPVVDAVSTPDGRGYWLVYSNGAVANFGDAGSFGNALGYVNVFNPATAIFPTADGEGYWVVAARGDVFSYGNATFLGGEAQAGLNGLIIAAYGF